MSIFVECLDENGRPKTIEFALANMLTGLVPNDNTIRRINAKPIIYNGNMALAQRTTS